MYVDRDMGLLEGPCKNIKYMGSKGGNHSSHGMKFEGQFISYISSVLRLQTSVALNNIDT